MPGRRLAIPLLCLCTAWFAAAAPLRLAARGAAGPAPAGCGCCTTAGGAAGTGLAGAVDGGCVMACCRTAAADGRPDVAHPTDPTRPPDSNRPVDEPPARPCGGACNGVPVVAAADAPLPEPFALPGHEPAASSAPPGSDVRPFVPVPLVLHARGPPAA